VHAGASPPNENAGPARTGLSKLNSVERRGRRSSRRPRSPDGSSEPSTGRGASGVRAPDSLERR